ncbi:MAG: metal-dependent hydrolase [Sulfuricaulis sp.]|nr:metal-dependent hydrolase [Sulfuricaulis sp.]
MDTLTHALSGALLARATEPEIPRADQLPRRARLWVGFWAAAFPDSDFITRFIDPLTYLTVHRGITHSVVMLPLWALGLSLLFMLLVRGKYPWRAFAGVVALGIGIHILGDVITAFGTMIFAPVSSWRAQIPTTFIIDPYFTAIIVAGLLASVVWKLTRTPAVFGLVVLAAYVGFQGILHQRAVAAGEAYVARHQLEGATVEAIPQPFSPFHWMIIIPQKDAYAMTYVSLWRNQIPEFPPEDANWLRQVYASYYPVQDAVWQHVPRFGEGKEVKLAEEVWYSETLAPYRGFALFPALYGVDRLQNRHCIWFNDLRFALAGRNMPFRYGACRNGKEAEWRVYRLLNDDNGQEIFELIPN